MAAATHGRAAGGPGVRLGLMWPGRTRLTDRTPVFRNPVTSLAARLRGPWLDRELAAGVAPWHSPAHSVRSLQITAPRARRGLARSLDQLIRRAAAPPPPSLSAVIPLDRSAVLAAQPVLERLGRRLRDGTPVSAQGVAALREVVADGCGPLYSAVSGDSLGRLLAAVAESLDVPD